jgi:hypothetical protein
MAEKRIDPQMTQMRRMEDGRKNQFSEQAS